MGGYADGRCERDAVFMRKQRCLNRQQRIMHVLGTGPPVLLGRQQSYTTQPKRLSQISESIHHGFPIQKKKKTKSSHIPLNDIFIYSLFFSSSVPLEVCSPLPSSLPLLPFSPAPPPLLSSSRLRSCWISGAGANLLFARMDFPFLYR